MLRLQINICFKILLIVLNGIEMPFASHSWRLGQTFNRTKWN